MRGLVSGARKPTRIEPEPRPRTSSGSGGAILTTTSRAPHRGGVAGELGARLGEGGIGQQGIGARAVLHDDVEALGLELGDHLRHERDTVLAGGGLSRNSDPHVRSENVSDRPDGG